jgi:hypothetical protein
MIAKARPVLRRRFNSYDQDWNYPLSRPDHTKADAVAVQVHNHLKHCSCFAYGCGNPRRCGGYQGPVLTRQEQLAELEFQEALEELSLL